MSSIPYLFKGFADAIEQTLSMFMLPRGRYVEFDIGEFSASEISDMPDMPSPSDQPAPMEVPA